jgi:hypothetical protein
VPLPLTLAEERLLSEVQNITDAIGMDFRKTVNYPKGHARRDYLKSIKDRLIRAEVIIKYTIVDEYLTMMICDYYFLRSKDTTYRKLWKTKPFRVFVHYLMDETFLNKKIAVVKAITSVPDNVSSAIMRINDVRNALAHSFFPENRRRYMPDKKVMYRGVDLMTLAGVEKFQEDARLASAFFQAKLLRRHWRN